MEAIAVVMAPRAVAAVDRRLCSVAEISRVVKRWPQARHSLRRRVESSVWRISTAFRVSENARVGLNLV